MGTTLTPTLSLTRARERGKLYGLGHLDPAGVESRLDTVADKQAAHLPRRNARAAVALRRSLRACGLTPATLAKAAAVPAPSGSPP